MATRIQVGKTWWGQAWLKALEGCDYANRLPRGKSYFVHGRVDFRGVDSESHCLEAFVHGSAYAPYVVNLGLKPFTQQECSRLLDRLSSDSLLLAQLLDGELPSEVAQICNELGIELFPNSSRDLTMLCTCPDSAHLCKHIAAFIYFLADVIDADPFVLFKIRGLDLVHALKAKGVSLEESIKEKPLTLEQLLEPIRSLPLKVTPDERLTLATLPLKSLKAMGSTLLDLLPQTIIQSNEKDLRDWLKNTLKRNIDKLKVLDESRWQRQQELEHSQCSSLSPFVQTADRLNVKTSLSLTLNDQTFAFELTKQPSTQDRLLQALWFVAPKEEKQLPSSTQGLRVVFDLAARFYAARAFVPCVVQSPVGGEDALPQVWMIPSLSQAETQRVFEQYLNAVKSSLADLFKTQLKSLSEADQAFLLLTGALTTLHSMLGLDADESDIFKILIAHPTYEVVKAPKQIGQALAQYFRVLNLGRAYPWQPLIKLTSLKDGVVSVGFGVLQREQNSKPVLLKALLGQERYRHDRLAVLNILRTLAELYEPFDQLARDGKNLKIERKALAEFIFEITPYLTLLGVKVLMPASLKRFISPKLVARASSDESFGKKLLGLEALSDFNWEVALGSNSLSKEEFQALVEHAGELVYNGTDYVYIDPVEIQKIQEKLEHPSELTSVQKLQAVLCGEVDGVPVLGTEALLQKLKALTEVSLVKAPASLKASLRPYQERGYSWLVKNLTLGMGALIADDMGLGKTLQVIAAVTHLKEAGELEKEKVLAVVPTTLLVNWQREIAKFSPQLKVALYHGPKRELPTDNYDVLLTTYGTARMDVEELKHMHYRLMIIDEAQAVKNSTSSQTKALKSLKARQVIGMSGTPVENRLMEYWSIFSLVQPKLLGTQKDFKEHFARPIEADRDPNTIDAFRKLTAPFMLRRLKTDKSIIADLPEKLVQDQFTSLRQDQAVLYEKFLKETLEKIETAIKKAKESGEDTRIVQRGLVLKLMTGLKQICNSVSQFQKTDSPYPDSGKGDMLIDLVERSFDAERKVLIFTQYREMGERLQTWLKSTLGEEALFLHGGVTVKRRAEMVDAFQNAPQTRVMILSLKAGGTGLNLTQASTVIHYDLWWNPAVEAQATDRAYRIGQKRDVLVYRFITKGTFEERINEMLMSKRELADLTVATGESWVGELPVNELKNLFKLEQ